MANDVRLTDLEVIQRYSIAVRGETADRDELLAALRADVAWLERGSARKAAAPAEKAEPAAKAPAKTAPARSAPARSAPARRVPVKPAKPAKPAKATRR